MSATPAAPNTHRTHWFDLGAEVGLGADALTRPEAARAAAVDAARHRELVGAPTAFDPARDPSDALADAAYAADLAALAAVQARLEVADEELAEAERALARVAPPAPLEPTWLVGAAFVLGFSTVFSLALSPWGTALVGEPVAGVALAAAGGLTLGGLTFLVHLDAASGESEAAPRWLWGGLVGAHAAVAGALGLSPALPDPARGLPVLAWFGLGVLATLWSAGRRARALRHRMEERDHAPLRIAVSLATARRDALRAARDGLEARGQAHRDRVSRETDALDERNRLADAAAGEVSGGLALADAGIADGEEAGLTTLTAPCTVDWELVAPPRAERTSWSRS